MKDNNKDCYIRLWATGGRSGWMYSKYIPLSGTNIIQIIQWHKLLKKEGIEERFKYWMMIGNYFLSYVLAMKIIMMMTILTGTHGHRVCFRLCRRRTFH